MERAIFAIVVRVYGYGSRYLELTKASGGFKSTCLLRVLRFAGVPLDQLFAPALTKRGEKNKDACSCGALGSTVVEETEDR